MEVEFEEFRAIAALFRLSIVRLLVKVLAEFWLFSIVPSRLLRESTSDELLEDEFVREESSVWLRNIEF